MRTRFLINITLIAAFLYTSSCTFVIQQTIGRSIVKKKFPVNSKIDLPFKIVLPYYLWNDVPIIKIHLNESDSLYHFIFDSGAYSSGSLNIARETIAQKIIENKYSTIDSNGETEMGENYIFNKMKLGNYIFNNIKLKCYNKLVDPSIDGVLGVDFMINKVFYFDNENKLLTITNYSTKNESVNVSKKIIKSWNNRFYLKLKVLDKRKKIMLDTGFDSFLKLDKETLKKKIPTKSFIDQRVGAFSEHYIMKDYYQFNDFTFANKHFDTVIIESGEKNIFGFYVFTKINIKLDFIKNKIVFFHGDFNLKLGNDIPKSLLVLGWDNNLIINKIESNTYTSLNLLPRDIILSINQSKVPKELNSIQSFMDGLEKTDDYTFEIQRGDSLFNCNVKRTMLLEK